MCERGNTSVTIFSGWRGQMLWGRNEITSSGDSQNTTIHITRNINGASGRADTNALDDQALKDCIGYAEHLVEFSDENPDQYPETPSTIYEHARPKLWFDTTYNLDDKKRGLAADSLIAPAQQEDLFSAGTLEVTGRGTAVINTAGLFRYYPHTTAQYSVTVRNPEGTGSGWAGVDFNDWTRIDAPSLSAIALDKCKRSTNPVAVEPGRYTAILEPQALCDIFAPILDRAMDRAMAELGIGPFAAGGGNSKIGLRLLDERLTVNADPMDPDAGFVPFDGNGEPYKAVNWFEKGILKELAYNRRYGLINLGIDEALPNSRAFRMSGGETSIDEMVATTERGVYVTRINFLDLLDFSTMLMSGNTRDGLWLVERGKITKPIKNFRITDSPLFALNNLVQIGSAQRVFRPGAPAVVPPVKVNDFSFTGMMDAV